MPWPIGTFPIVDPDQYEGRMPALSPGKSTPVRRPKPKRPIHRSSLSFLSISASVIAPTFDERERICATLICSVPRCSASWMTRSATWIEYGSVNVVPGCTMPSESAPATVTSLKVEPGSYVSTTARFAWSATGTLAKRFAS